jgi:DNA-binding transcriptional LysR family regulator
MDRLEAMSILIATVEAGSFSGASRALGMPLPSVSRKVAELERHLATRLLVRTTRKLALTEAGAEYLSASRRILELVREAEAAAAREHIEPRGELLVTAPVAFGRLHVLPIVTDFLAAHPQIDIRLVLADRNVDLVDAHIDVAVRIGELPDSSLVATQIGTVRRIIVASPDYLASRGTPTRPEDLAGHDCVTFAGPSPSTSWHLRPASGGGAKATPRRRLVVDTAEAAIDVACAGVGLTRLLSYQPARALAEGKLVEVLAEFAELAIPAHVLHAGQGRLPLKTRRFLDFGVPRLRAVLAR